jgi:signal transduction histidine kinase
MLYQGIAEGKGIDEVTKGNLMMMVARNVDKESLASEAFQASRTVIARVEETHQPSVITDASSDEGLKTQASVVKYNLRSILCVPLITKKEEILGIIYLDNRLISGLFTQRDLDLLKTLATQAGISIENVMLVENEKEMARKVSEAEARARYADILQKKNKELEIAYQEKGQAYEELKATQAQLVQSEKMATIGRLAGGVAHEINTPLGTILTNTEMLMLEGSTTDSQRECLELVKDSSLRCKAIVEQLLKYSRLPGPEFEMVDIAQVIDESYFLLERQLVDDGVRVNREYSAIPEIKANANELRQVFTNIILNARDAIKKTFDDKKRQGEIKVRAYQEGMFLVVEVQDDGCGIPPQDIDKIFDPFFTTKDIGEGTGLGLSVSLRIIERHGGKIEASSKVGQGTTMRVELPIGERETVKNKRGVGLS